MNTQAHIYSLIQLLSKSPKEDYTNILLNFNFQNIDFSEIEHWVPQSYTRNCFYRDENFELILICWDEALQTAIHNHDGEECWVYLLDGELEEDFYEMEVDGKLNYISTKVLKPNEVTKSDEVKAFHRLRNGQNAKALSLHVYAKPIEQSLTFDEHLDKLVDTKLSYDTYKSIVPTQVN